MPTLNIAPYLIDAPATIVDGVLQTGNTTPYPIKDALINVLFAQTGLKARDILRRDDLARKIHLAETDTIDLTDAEQAQLTNAFDAMEGFGRNDVELVRRVLGDLT